MARAELLPDESGNDLSSLLGGGGAGGLLSLGALLGNHQSIEADLTIGRSQAVLRDVVSRMHLTGRPGYGEALTTQAKLRKKVDIAALRGSILQITVKDKDPAFAREIVAAYVTAIQTRLTTLNLNQVTQRRSVAAGRLVDAAGKLTEAEAAITRFRTENRLAAPEAQLGAAVTVMAGLQGQLEAKQVQLQSLQQFATPENIQVKMVESEVAGLRTQIAKAQSEEPASGGPTLGDMGVKTSEYFNLYRDQRFAAALYEIYRQALEKVTVEELTANVTVDVIEPPYIEPSRQFNNWAVGALVLVILIAITSEFYIIAPPVGRPRWR
jgi:capsule polysaccharide export protein KpsE/RkpR